MHCKNKNCITQGNPKSMLSKIIMPKKTYVVCKKYSSDYVLTKSFLIKNKRKKSYFIFQTNIENEMFVIKMNLLSNKNTEQVIIKPNRKK